MADIFWMDKVIELDKYISLNDLQQMKDRGPVVSLWPAPGRHTEARGEGWWREWGARPVPCSFSARDRAASAAGTLGAGAYVATHSLSSLCHLVLPCPWLL